MSYELKIIVKVYLIRLKAILDFRHCSSGT